eukprot:TRINITY_DN595_c1_g1_i1.p3 TRINITY_DN595_c1_g1~~TRINITY_DN595_c1_g1_i1.p3  ORF type:complete len:251 (-),score=41.00 TRINITY_DN595_c1_g1_i1:274-1026(-)
MNSLVFGLICICTVIGIVSSRELQQTLSNSIFVDRNSTFSFTPQQSNIIVFNEGDIDTRQGFVNNSAFFFGDEQRSFTTNTSVPQAPGTNSSIELTSSIDGNATAPGFVTAVSGGATLNFDKVALIPQSTVNTVGGIRSAAQGSTPTGSGVGFNVIGIQSSTGEAAQRLIASNRAESFTADNDTASASQILALTGAEASGLNPTTSILSATFAATTDDRARGDCTVSSSAIGQTGNSQSGCIGQAGVRGV